MYVPNNVNVFCAAYAGAFAGMGFSGRQPQSALPSAYAPLANVAGAFAIQFDTIWASLTPTQLDIELIEAECESFWLERDARPTTVNLTPTSYDSDARAIIASIIAARSYFAGQGITPPAIPSGGGGASAVIFRPGAATSAPFYSTWAEVKTLIDAAKGAITAYIDSSLAPAILDIDTDGLSRLILSPARGPVGGIAMTLSIADGHQLKNIAGVDGQLIVDALATSVLSPFAVDNNNIGVFLSNGAAMTLLPGSTRSFVDVAAGAANTLAMRADFSSKFSSQAPGITFANLLGVGSVFLNFYTGLSPFTQPQANTVNGPIGSTWIMVYDSSATIPSQPNMLGSILYFQIDHGSIIKTQLDYPLSRLQSVPGISISAVFPIFGDFQQPSNCQLVSVDIETVQQLASPLMTASDAQVVDGTTFNGFTGLADTLNTSGFNAPPPQFMQATIDPATHLPNLVMTITGDTFDQLTAGHIRSTLNFCPSARTN